MKQQLAWMDFALGSLARRRAKSLSIAFGLTLVVAAFSGVLFLTDALSEEFRRTSALIPELTVQRVVGGRPALLESGEHVRAIEGVRAVRTVTPRVWGYLYLPALEFNVTIIGVTNREDQQSESTRVASMHAIEGRLPRENEQAVAIGPALARELGVERGDEIVLPLATGPRPLRIVGILRPETALLSSDVILTSTSEARRLLDLPEGSYTDLAITLRNPLEKTIVAERVLEIMPGARVLERDLLARTYELTFSTRGGFLTILFLPALLLALLIAWERLTTTSDTERREIAVLKAVGWHTREILLVRSWEAFFISAGAVVGGLVLAYVHVFVFDAVGIREALMGWSLLEPEFALIPSISFTQLLTIFSAVVVPFVSLSVLPAWRIAMIDPDRAFRGHAE